MKCPFCVEAVFTNGRAMGAHLWSSHPIELRDNFTQNPRWKKMACQILHSVPGSCFSVGDDLTRMYTCIGCPHVSKYIKSASKHQCECKLGRLVLCNLLKESGDPTVASGTWTTESERVVPSSSGVSTLPGTLASDPADMPRSVVDGTIAQMIARIEKLEADLAESKRVIAYHSLDKDAGRNGGTIPCASASVTVPPVAVTCDASVGTYINMQAAATSLPAVHRAPIKASDKKKDAGASISAPLNEDTHEDDVEDVDDVLPARTSTKGGMSRHVNKIVRASV